VTPFSPVTISLRFGISVGVVLWIWRGTPKVVGLELPKETLVFGHIEILFQDGNDALSIVCVCECIVLLFLCKIGLVKKENSGQLVS